MLLKVMAEHMTFVRQEVFGLEKLSKAENRNIPLKKFEAIFTPLLVMVIEKSDEPLAEILRKMISTHLNPAKQTLSENFVKQTRYLTTHLFEKRSSHQSMILLYKALSSLYINIKDHKELNFLSVLAIRKMKDAPLEIKNKYAKSIQYMLEDYKSSTAALELAKEPKETQRKMSGTEVETLTVLSSAIDDALEVLNQFNDIGILLEKDYADLKTILQKEIDRYRATPQ